MELKDDIEINFSLGNRETRNVIATKQGSLEVISQCGEGGKMMVCF